MSNRSVGEGVSLARVMAHCGGSPGDAVRYLVGAIGSAPEAPEPYDAVMALGSVTGVRPDVAWGAAPWFGDAGLLGPVDRGRVGDLEQAAAAFGSALGLDPANWSVCLDLADVRAVQGDFAAAVDLVEQGLRHEPDEVVLRAAGAAYRTRLTGSSADLRDLIALAPQLTNTAYRELLIGYACEGSGLPPALVAEARSLGNS